MKSQLYRCGEKTITVVGENADEFVINNRNGDPYVPDWLFKRTGQPVVDVEGTRYTLTDEGLQQV